MDLTGKKGAMGLISADSHVLEPPDLWTKRVPAKLRDRAPRMQRFEQGDAWVVEGYKEPISFGINACAGLPAEQQRGWLKWEEIRPAGHDPRARLADQDADFTRAEILYPTPRLSGNILLNPDSGYQVAMIRAYNDWLSEFCSVAPKRLCGLALMPLCGAKEAVGEIERALKLPGMVGVNIAGYPSGDPEPQPEDDALFDYAASRNMPLSIHVGFAANSRERSKTLRGDVRFYDAPGRIVQLIFSGVLDRYPNLKIVIAEVDVGWVPYFKEQIDDRFQRLNTASRFKLQAKPSEYVERHFYFTYITDHFGIRNRDAVGVDRIMWSSDYPHVGADWPNTARTVAGDFAGVSPEVRDRILSGNASELYGI